MEIARREFTRKDVLKMGLLGSAALLFPLERTARTKLSVNDRLPESMLPRPFQVPFSVPEVARKIDPKKLRNPEPNTDYYEMTMKQARLQILPGRPPTEVWGYDGTTPGPTIHATRGRNVVVRHINAITNPAHTHTSVHLHGNASLPQYDGYASDVIRPNHFKDYHYPNEQDARTLWYHDHGAHDTSLNAYMGCAAFYITHDELEESLMDPENATYKDRGTAIPTGEYDVPIVLRDAIFGKNGQMIFDDQGHSTLMGDVILTNGAPWPMMQVERRKYRFRFLNAAISRSFDLRLSTGDPMTVIGTDGGLMSAPVETPNLRLGMAERYEVVVDFSKYAPRTKVDLLNRGLPNNRDYSSTRNILRFEVLDSLVDRTPLPAELHPDNEIMELTERDASLETRRNPVKLALVRKHGKWTVNGRIWKDIELSKFQEVVANPKVGEAQVWEFENKSGGWFHPMHIHQVDFRILSRTGGKVPGLRPYEQGPKDTIYLGEGEKIRVVARFGPYEGAT